MARELHDVVSHNISVINVQANTALYLMDRQPERARQALSTINEVSKQALVELRSVLGVLREVDEQAPRSPIPTLARLEDLIVPARAAGLLVEGWSAPGEGRSRCGANVDLAAYRIVQEALTNAAPPFGGSNAVVQITFGERDLVVQVDDDGIARAPREVNGPGNGIAGMRERANGLGGELTVGPRSDAGVFRVRARLPLDLGGP